MKPIARKAELSRVQDVFAARNLRRWFELWHFDNLKWSIQTKRLFVLFVTNN